MTHSLTFDIFENLDTQPIQLHHLQFVDWGRSFLFNAQHETTPFEWHIMDCREVKWQFFGHLAPSDISFPVTTLEHIVLGRDQHRSSLQILTTHFGLSAYYGTMTLTSLE